jgi:hypothetical protein
MMIIGKMNSKHRKNVYLAQACSVYSMTIPILYLILVSTTVLDVRGEITPRDTEIVWTVDGRSQWEEYTGEIRNADIRRSENVGGKFDLMGDGSLLLRKSDPGKRFHQSDYFVNDGRWISKWYALNPNEDLILESLSTDLVTYGGEIDLADWILFENNPVASDYDYQHQKKETAVLPPDLKGQPQDQSVIVGNGRFEGKWLLLFNIGSYAVNGWGGMIAESLEPLKRGVNPFSLITDPYPMHGPGEHNAPNDWIEVNGVYYTAATTPGPASIWSSPDLAEWTHEGPLYNQVGSDPGIVFDGEDFHLFIEDGNYIRHCLLRISENRCASCDVVLDVGTHTGDPDINFFNNRWHMFIDVERDGEYEIGYASTTASAFPYGWRLHPGNIFGPDDLDIQRKESDYTGDPDIALEEETLYLFYENPVRVAFNELDELRSTRGHETRIRIEADEDGDGEPDQVTRWYVLEGGRSVLREQNELEPVEGKKFRVLIDMKTTDSGESPMIKSFALGVRRK